ncbi:MAG: hypothetical protein ABUL64_03730, partial [Singulisphaera sp.]
MVLEFSPTRYRSFVVMALGIIQSLAVPAWAGVDYQNPTGGWRYSYDGTFNAGINGLPAGYGDSGRQSSLDGTWRHDQSDKWDGSG